MLVLSISAEGAIRVVLVPQSKRRKSPDAGATIKNGAVEGAKRQRLEPCRDRMFRAALLAVLKQEWFGRGDGVSSPRAV